MCVCLSFQTQEALFATLRITFFRYAWCTSPINDNYSPCFGFNEVLGLPIWIFRSQILKFCFYKRTWQFLKIKKARKHLAFFDFFSVGKTWLWQNIVWTRGGRSHFFRLWLHSCSKIFESGPGSGSGYFSNFMNPTPIQTPATITDPTVIYSCFYLRNDHTDSCYCQNWKVTPDPGSIFHKFLTPRPDPARKKNAESCRNPLQNSWSGATSGLSCTFIASLFWPESMTMQGVKNIEKIFLLP